MERRLLAPEKTKTVSLTAQNVNVYNVDYSQKTSIMIEILKKLISLYLHFVQLILK